MAEKRKAAVSAEVVTAEVAKRKREVSIGRRLGSVIHSVAAPTSAHAEPEQSASPEVHFDDGDDGAAAEDRHGAAAEEQLHDGDGDAIATSSQKNYPRPPASSFANLMLKRQQDGGKKLTKKQKRQLRKAWKKSKSRQARGLAKSGDDDETNDFGLDFSGGGGGNRGGKRRHDVAADDTLSLIHI